MSRRWIYGLVIAGLVINLTIGAQLFFTTPASADAKDSPDASEALFSEVLQKIRAQYVDGTNLTYHALTYAALKGMVSKLDPHSEFLDPASYKRLQDDTKGQFGGLGLLVRELNGYITVIAPIDDTPGSRAGIISGDRIVKVGRRDVKKANLEDVVKILRGEPGTKVTLTIQRPPTGELKEFTLQRAIIQRAMVQDINGEKQFPLDENKIGYVRLNEFGDGVSDELEDALQKMKAQGLKGMILDLRWNPGGLLDEAVAVCQKFLPRGKPIVSTEGRHVIERYYAKGDGDELKGVPIVILVNLSSASAAEIVTGCLQDWHRAYVVGEKTFGKGSVQTIFPLDDGSALKLTIAKYYTPSHKVIHEHGIAPDSYVPITDLQEAAIYQRRSLGGLQVLPDKERALVEKIKDVQLERAEDLLKSLSLYARLSPPSQPKKVATK